MIIKMHYNHKDHENECGGSFSCYSKESGYEYEKSEFSFGNKNEYEKSEFSFGDTGKLSGAFNFFTEDKIHFPNKDEFPMELQMKMYAIELVNFMINLVNGISCFTNDVINQILPFLLFVFLGYFFMNKYINLFGTFGFFAFVVVLCCSYVDFNHIVSKELSGELLQMVKAFGPIAPIVGEFNSKLDALSDSNLNFLRSIFFVTCMISSYILMVVFSYLMSFLLINYIVKILFVLIIIFVAYHFIGYDLLLGRIDKDQFNETFGALIFLAIMLLFVEEDFLLFSCIFIFVCLVVVPDGVKFKDMNFFSNLTKRMLKNQMICHERNSSKFVESIQSGKWDKILNFVGLFFVPLFLWSVLSCINNLRNNECDSVESQTNGGEVYISNNSTEDYALTDRDLLDLYVLSLLLKRS